MTNPVATLAAAAFVLILAAATSGAESPESRESIDAAQALVNETCYACHNDAALVGNMSLETFEVAKAEDNAALAEKMIRKLRVGMMPPAGVPRPSEDSLLALATVLETRLDSFAATSPNPGRRTFQRLNRAEDGASVRDLLALDIDAGDYLPLDTKASKAYRKPLAPNDLGALMSLYQIGATDAGFESGIRTALEGILTSPHFVFRFEEPPADARPGEMYRIRDIDLATRLSFFLWGTGPDEELMAVARDGGLSDSDVLEAEARRMLADPRSAALSPRFAAQWLRLQDLEKMHPNVRTYPDFHDQLKASMRLETKLFFESLVRDDRSVLELLTADYTFLDERLAEHYGIRDVRGDDFRRVSYPDERRRGLLGHGSVLTLTSHASRTSPVLRGKWIMEVLLGSPPPPPPPNVPELDEVGEAAGGRLLSVREQMEKHRADPACNSCHRVIDPLGLALENFDASGAWRIRDRGVDVDASGELYDGTPLRGPDDLRKALLTRSTSLIRTFTENLMAYALGRRVEYYDMPAVRAIERDASAHDNRMSAFILGVVKSPAFRMKAAPAPDVRASGEP